MVMNFGSIAFLLSFSVSCEHRSRGWVPYNSNTNTIEDGDGVARAMAVVRDGGIAIAKATARQDCGRPIIRKIRDCRS